MAHVPVHTLTTWRKTESHSLRNLAWDSGGVPSATDGSSQFSGLCLASTFAALSCSSNSWNVLVSISGVLGLLSLVPRPLPRPAPVLEDLTSISPPTLPGSVRCLLKAARWRPRALGLWEFSTPVLTPVMLAVAPDRSGDEDGLEAGVRDFFLRRLEDPSGDLADSLVLFNFRGVLGWPVLLKLRRAVSYPQHRRGSP